MACPTDGFAVAFTLLHRIHQTMYYSSGVMNLLFMCLDDAKCEVAQLIVQKEAFLSKPNTNTVLPGCRK